ncbi:MAG: PH domain-containing protein [Roseibacillus sp.]
MSEEPEKAAWRGGPSQLVNLPAFVASAVVASIFFVVGPRFPEIQNYIMLGALIPALWAGWKWLTVRCHRFEISTERLKMFEGVLNRSVDEIELYRVKDTQIQQPILYRLFGLGHVILETSDRSHPKATLNAIKAPREVGEILRREVESLRDKKRVREVDFDESGDSEFGDELG